MNKLYQRMAKTVVVGPNNKLVDDIINAIVFDVIDLPNKNKYKKMLTNAYDLFLEQKITLGVLSSFETLVAKSVFDDITKLQARYN